MGHMYTAVMATNAITTAKVLAHINGITNGTVVIHSAFFGQFSDAGDAQAELLPIQIARYASNSVGNGTTVTPRPHQKGDQAYSGTVIVAGDNTATNHIMFAETFNVQAGWYYTPTPEERIVIPPKSVGATHPSLRFRLPNAPNDSITMMGRVTFEVIN